MVCSELLASGQPDKEPRDDALIGLLKLLDIDQSGGVSCDDLVASVLSGASSPWLNKGSSRRTGGISSAFRIAKMFGALGSSSNSVDSSSTGERSGHATSKQPRRLSVGRAGSVPSNVGTQPAHSAPRRLSTTRTS